MREPLLQLHVHLLRLTDFEFAGPGDGSSGHLVATDRYPGGSHVLQSPSRHGKFRRIFDLHLPAVQRYCVRRLSVADANDAVSEVFLAVWRRIDDVPDGDETFPWLIGVARNAVRNMQRAGRRSARLAVKAHGVAVDQDPGPEPQVVRAAEYSEVAAALETLSDTDREVIRLRAWEELTVPEMAVVLGCSEAAASKRIVRATARLSRAVERASLRPRAIRKGGGA